MVFNNTRYNQPTTLEDTFERSKVELGTFIPLKQQIAQFHQAGINLSAIRQTQADFASGIEDWRLDEFEDPTADLTLDQIDILRLKKQYYEKKKTYDEFISAQKEEASKKEASDSASEPAKEATTDEPDTGSSKGA